MDAVAPADVEHGAGRDEGTGADVLTQAQVATAPNLVWPRRLGERRTVSTDCCSYNDGMPTVAIEQSLRELFAAHPEGIVAAYLFGSVARGTAGARSDVDVAVLEAAPPATLEGRPLDLENQIARRVGRPAEVSS